MLRQTLRYDDKGVELGLLNELWLLLNLRKNLFLPTKKVTCYYLSQKGKTAFITTNARHWEPKKLRARLFEIDGKVLTHARHATLHVASAAPDAHLLPKA